MKLIGSFLIAAAFGHPVKSPHAYPEKSGYAVSGHRSSHHSASMRSSSGNRSGYGGRSGSRSGSRSGHRSGSPEYGHKSPQPEWEWPMESGKKHHTEMKDEEKGCNNCGSSQNTNFAPVNTNMQNFVNIETDIETNINVNMGGGGPSHGKSPHHDMDSPHHDMDELFEEYDGDDMKDHDWGMDSELSFRDVISFLGDRFGIDSGEDLFEMLEKEDIKKMIVNLLHSFMPEQGNDTHDHDSDDHTTDHDDQDDHDNHDDQDMDQDMDL